MKKEQAEAFEFELRRGTTDDVENKISSIKSKISAITERNEILRADPRKVLREMKEVQLREALEAYGKVDLSLVDMERIPLIFARLQADEAAARKDIITLKGTESAEKDLKKQLEIANKVLAIKASTGGRS